MIQLRTVTWYSKALAVLLFIAVFSIGFYLGMEYAEVHSSNTNSYTLSEYSGDPTDLLDHARITIPAHDVSFSLEDGRGEFIDPQTGQLGTVVVGSVRDVWKNGTRTDVVGVLHVTVGENISHSYLATFSVRASKALQRSLVLLGDRADLADLQIREIINPSPGEDYLIALSFSEEDEIPPQFFLVGENELLLL